MKRAKYDRLKLIIDFVLRHNIPIISGYIKRSLYDKEFFNNTIGIKIKSSRNVAEIITSFYDFKTVFDVGCGMGIYLSEFEKLGKETYGCDASKDAIALSDDRCLIFYADVTKEIYINRRFDLVICFEVAEHIPKRYSNTLVHNCVKLSDTVIFTAAPKGQGGVGHINEQPYDYWITLFKDHGYAYDKQVSLKMKEIMKKRKVVEWLANNVMCFNKRVENQNDE